MRDFFSADFFLLLLPFNSCLLVNALLMFIVAFAFYIKFELNGREIERRNVSKSGGERLQGERKRDRNTKFGREGERERNKEKKSHVYHNALYRFIHIFISIKLSEG